VFCIHDYIEQLGLLARLQPQFAFSSETSSSLRCVSWPSCDCCTHHFLSSIGIFFSTIPHKIETDTFKSKLDNLQSQRINKEIFFFFGVGSQHQLVDESATLKCSGKSARVGLSEFSDKMLKQKQRPSLDPVIGLVLFTRSQSQQKCIKLKKKSSHFRTSK
jgi:hypothetical protein